jgi:hypothetical protein
VGVGGAERIRAQRRRADGVEEGRADGAEETLGVATARTVRLGATAVRADERGDEDVAGEVDLDREG